MMAGSIRRVVVIGTTGAGKTALARLLSSKLGVPHVEFDAYRHGPNWKETPDDVFRRNIQNALKSEGWVADGNYSIARDIVWSNATTLIWLDYSFGLVFWRLFWRTIGRAVRRTELWNGNREAVWRHFLTTDSLFLWAFKTHWSRRRRLAAVFDGPEYAHLTVIRFRTPSQLSDWMRSGDWPDRVAAERLVR
jgi:adenylate kinase family enzyme